MKRLSRLFAALSFIILPASLSLANGKAVSLKQEYPVGSRLVYQTDMVQKQNIVMPQMTMQNEITSGQTFALDVLSATTDGGRKFSLEFLSFKMAMTGMMPMSFDSSSDPAQDAGNPLAILRKMVGSKLTFTLKSDGSVASLEGADALAQKLGGGAAGVQGLDQIVKQMGSEGSLRQMFPSLQTPTKPVAPGHGWPINESFEMGEMGTVSIKLKNVFTGVENRSGSDCALIDATGTLSMNMDISKATEGAPAGMKMVVKDGKIKGRSIIDLKAARLQESSTDTIMKMEMAMGEAAGGMTMTMDMDQKQVTKFVKAEKIK